VIAGDLIQYGQSMGGTSYCSSHDKRLFSAWEKDPGLA
jgi:hypothetical protein